MRSLVVVMLLAGVVHADRPRARTHAISARRRMNDEDKARAALAVIDGATWIGQDEWHGAQPPRRERFVEDRRSGSASTRGPDPRIGDALPRGDGYLVRRPERAYGAHHVIAHLEHSIAEVRALYPNVHTLAIGDLSAEHGGKIADHVSHRTGLDVDVGFYFHHQPDNYPERFAAADDDLDLEATWALLTAFARTTQLRDGVEIMFLDYGVQRRLYHWAATRGTPEEDLAHLLQYPRGKDAQEGLIRHWPNHADHVHVRFKRP